MAAVSSCGVCERNNCKSAEWSGVEWITDGHLLSGHDGEKDTQTKRERWKGEGKEM